MSLVPQRFQEDFRELLCRIWVAVKVYTSTSKVNSTQFRNFCLDTYALVFNKFNNEPKWISVSPTVHSLLAHGWEVITNHDDTGMGEFTESGLENNNKFLRFYRRNLARKTDQSANLEDCLTRLWLRSDPVIRSTAPSPKCSKCQLNGHFTVSCPAKKASPVSSNLSLDDFFLSALLTE